MLILDPTGTYLRPPTTFADCSDIARHPPSTRDTFSSPGNRLEDACLDPTGQY